MNFVFAFFGQEAEVHRTVERVQNLCRCAEVNGAKTKSLRCRLVERLIGKKSRARKPCSAQRLYMGVLSDDFAAVDFREELCYHSRPKEAKFKRNTVREKSKEESRARRKKREPVRSGSAGTAPRRRAFGLIFRAVSFDGRVLVSAPERVARG